MMQAEGAAESASESVDMFSPVSAGRISGAIVEQIRALIRSGHLRHGDRLPSERELATRFGVSRVTVRDALRVLESAGLIEIRVGARGGAFLTAPSVHKVGEGLSDMLTMSSLTAAEVTEARMVFEVAIMDLVCERATDADLDALAEICDRSEAAVAAGTYSMELSAEFHIRLARCTHNRALDLIVSSFQGALRASLFEAQATAPAMGILGAKEHRSLVNALRRRDAAKAVTIMQRHLARTASRLRTGEADESPPLDATEV
jgi:DNA-binding FadR family transcriptional regulator